VRAPGSTAPTTLPSTVALNGITLSVPSSILLTAAANLMDTYSVSLTVSNWLGASATVNRMFNRSALPTPTVSTGTPVHIRIDRTSSLIVAAKISYPAICSALSSTFSVVSSSMTITWSQVDLSVSDAALAGYLANNGVIMSSLNPSQFGGRLTLSAAKLTGAVLAIGGTNFSPGKLYAFKATATVAVEFGSERVYVQDFVGTG